MDFFYPYRPAYFHLLRIRPYKSEENHMNQLSGPFF